MRYCGQCAVLALLLLLLDFSNGELILVRKQDEVYCMESNSSNKALTWIPAIERNKEITYEEEVPQMPIYDVLDEFRHLNCDLMRDGGCPLAEKHTEFWEIIDHASDEYGFISDRRWHALPMYNTSGNPHEMQEIPMRISKKGTIHMSILAKNNAIITAFDEERGYIIIKLDAYIRDGIRRSLAFCPRTINKQCNGEEIARTFGSTLTDGERWKNVKIVIEKNMRGRELFIKIDNDVTWNVQNTFDRNDYGNFQVKNLFIATANQQMGFWKFHDYRALRLKERSQVLTLDFETRNNPQLCLSILYHSGNSHNGVPTAATLTIASNTETLNQDDLEAGTDWQEYRHIFELQIHTKYQLSLMPMDYYSTFAIGEIRVCQESEYSVIKMKTNQEEKNVKCSILNENKDITEKLFYNEFSYKCQNGNLGENCDIPCLKFGSNKCKGLRVCSTNFCSCLPGYNGTYCERECQGTYGPRCRMSCNYCRNRTQCDFVTGACPNVECEDGYRPGQNALCKDECIEGTFGRNCNQKCSAFCPTAPRCNHTDGSCTEDKCTDENYEPPSCQYPRIVIRVPPQLKYGVNSLKLSIPPQGIPYEIHHLIDQIGVQYRLHDQNTETEWRDGVRLPFSDDLTVREITLSGLAPKATYDVRVILYDERGNGNFGDKVPVLSAVTTLCKPAEIQVEPERKIIKVNIIISDKNEECVQSSDYVISIRGTGKYITLNEDLTGHSAELEPDMSYAVEVTASDMLESFNVFIGPEPTSAATTIIGVLIFLIFVLLAFTLAFRLYQKRNAKSLDREKLHRSLTSNGSEGPPGMAMLERPPEAPPRPLQEQALVKLVQPEIHTCRIRVKDLAEYVDTAVATGQLRVQHALFPRGQTQPWVEGKKPEHRGKNRYGNLVAYDHTRVVLNPLPKQPHSHYINANFIDGYNAPRAYIATQGPKESTLGDFWRMIWQENVFTVVMLANVVENGKAKCEQYWPKIGATIEHGGVKIRTTSEVEYLDFVQREFEATVGSKTRKLTHLHYTTWPDHGVPRYPHSLAAFMRFVLDASSTLPILVHCSAGVGRTGTVVLVHACYRMAEVEATVDPLALMSKMRSQRSNMVDNPDQYEAVHRVLVELLTVVDTRIKVESFSQTVRNLFESGEMQEQYREICAACVRDIEIEEDGLILWPRDKNRYPNIVPGDGGRVVLNRTEGGDYINAVYVDGVTSRNSYIVTQLPLPGTLGDFWLMAWQRASVIVVLNQPDPLHDQSMVELWREHEELRVSQSMSVSVKQSTNRKLFEITTVELRNEDTIQGTRKAGRREIPVLTLKGWYPRQEYPPRPEDVVQVWSEAERLRADSAAKFPVVVVCHDGATACGIFVAAAHTFEGLKAWKTVDIGRAMRSVRHNRPQFIRSVEQYDCLHRMVLAYLDMFDSYANFE